MITCRCPGQTLDFIELDGSIDTSLDIADATVNQTAATWTWSVTSSALGGWRFVDSAHPRIEHNAATTTDG